MCLLIRHCKFKNMTLFDVVNCEFDDHFLMLKYFQFRFRFDISVFFKIKNKMSSH